MTNKEWRLERLRWEDWERFLASVSYAKKQIQQIIGEPLKMTARSSG
jgi:hypothetical protein